MSVGSQADSLKGQFGPRLLDVSKQSGQRLLALQILRAALAAVDPAEAVQRHVQRNCASLTIGDRQLDLSAIGRIVAVGGGKAGGPMAQALETILDDRLEHGWVNVKSGHRAPTRVVHLHEAGHPLPDAESVRGSLAIRQYLTGLGESDLVLGLISGGGSALLTLPREGISLTDLQETTERMLRAGADITQLNTVRKHLDLVKGGGLARLAAPARLITLVLSDVVGDPLDVIASGPTVPDPSTFADARRVFEQLGLTGKLPTAVESLLERGAKGEEPETPKPGDPIFTRTETIVIGSNARAAQAAVETATHQGWTVLDLGSRLEGEAREVGRVLGALARSVQQEGRPVSPPACIIAGGETVVTVRGTGRGGRNQELALGAALVIHGLSDVLVVSLGTDGTDGPTDAAGAVADGTTLMRARALGHDPHTALAQNDSYAFFDALGDLIITGPTRTNVNDLMCVFVGSPS